MKFKRILSSAAALAVAAAAAMTMMISSVCSAETALNYTGPSEKAFALNDDGSTLRLNLFNEWSKGQETADVAKSGSFSEAINVTFTISGLNGGCNVNEDGSDGEPYYAELVGSVGDNNYWGTSNPSGNSVTNDRVAITDNGQYTASFKLSTPADTILCLILTSNINAYNYASSGKPADTGITIKVDKVTTGAGEPEETDPPETEPPETEATESTEATETTEAKVTTAVPDATEATSTTKVTQAVTSTTDKQDSTQPSTSGTEAADETKAPDSAATEAATTVQTTAAQVSPNNNNNSNGSTSGNQVSNSTSGAPITSDVGVAIAFAGLAATAAIGVLTQIRKK